MTWVWLDGQLSGVCNKDSPESELTTDERNASGSKTVQKCTLFTSNHAVIERRIAIHAARYGLPPKHLLASARRLRHKSDQIQQETEPSRWPLVDNNYVATIVTIVLAGMLWTARMRSAELEQKKRKPQIKYSQLTLEQGKRLTPKEQNFKTGLCYVLCNRREAEGRGEADASGGGAIACRSRATGRPGSWEWGRSLVKWTLTGVSWCGRR